MDPTAVPLTPAQLRAAEHEGPRLVVVGQAATGKTEALLARHRALVGRHRSERVLAVCRHRAAAQRFLAAALPHLRGGYDTVPVTTVHGLAYDLVRRSGAAVALASGGEQRALVERLLAREEPAAWPVCGRFLGRPGFVDEVVRRLALLRELGSEGTARAVSTGGPWAELAAFAPRYEEALTQAGLVDSGGLLVAGAELAAAAAERFDHVLADDASALSALGARLLARLVEGGDVGLTVAVDPGEGDGAAALVAGAVEVALDRRFRVGPPGRLVQCPHPSVEAEAVAGELLAAARAGVPWSEMAVLVRGLGRRARTLGRALARHGIPAVPAPALAREEPAVEAVIDVLRWVAGNELPERLLVSPVAGLSPAESRAVRLDARAEGRPVEHDPRLAGLVALRDRLRAGLARGDTPADLAYEVWAAAYGGGERGGLGAAADRALDALVALVDGLRSYAERHPGATLAQTLDAVDAGELVPAPWRAVAPLDGGGVTITPIAAAAGLAWRTVVVAGCLEGELPRGAPRGGLFDPARLGAPAAGELEGERRLFGVATSRATESLVAVAAPEPGVLLSRFVESWEPAGVKWPTAPGQPPPARARTAGAVPVWPSGQLSLSASQLATYDDCPLRYAYQYVLKARDEPGVHAGLGSLVHKVLETFLDPAADPPAPRTMEGLTGVAAEVWDDGIARYRPQAEQARRDFVAMLASWWESEGAAGPEVLAVERRFEIPVGPHRLAGSIDRIDRSPDGAGVRVVDYKTGRNEPRPGDVEEDLQLAIYHLAATRDPDLAALGPPARLELHYLRSMRTYAQPIREDHAARTEERVLEVAERILAEEFEPSVHANCRTCPFHRLCPLQPEGRNVGAA
ncbi:MAG: PD-(D/E)XK nuclease family protein [Acidimicrobiia bacterium]